ncbi:MAG: hypothetical protein WA151_21295 [Desulfatirhabdiaceae bacterium]
MSDRRIMPLPGGRAVLAENGPLHMVIQAFQGPDPHLERAMDAAEYAFDCLKRVADQLPVLKRWPGDIHALPSDPIPRAMVESVRAIGDSDLTPMAAVAGTLADAVADWLFELGLSRVIVDNGGDIAIRLAPGETARVGLRPEIQHPEISHVLTLDSRHRSWGVNTSGLGGRSFTCGVASAVTAIARTSSLADAAATAVANACFVAGADVVQMPAEQLDPNTDIPGLLVTVTVGRLSPTQTAEALSNALKKAEQLTQKGVILGALVAVGNQMVQTADLSDRVAGLESIS